MYWEKQDVSRAYVAESSDDSYVSAGEDPLEAPVFEFPLQDTVASTGAEVVLKCIISGTPLPEGTSCIFFPRLYLQLIKLTLLGLLLNCSKSK